MARFEDYATKYQTIRMERREGILQFTFHTNGGPLQWGLLPHGEFPEAFRDGPKLSWINLRASAMQRQPVVVP